MMSGLKPLATQRADDADMRKAARRAAAEREPDASDASVQSRSGMSILRSGPRPIRRGAENETPAALLSAMLNASRRRANASHRYGEKGSRGIGSAPVNAAPEPEFQPYPRLGAFRPRRAASPQRWSGAAS